ncbi:MAG: hypothetical protein IH931_07265, partial [candidate division Zixibacteria bacterium]|nr:hypothetical protein [candidate division Zixibacteria bacterium]
SHHAEGGYYLDAPWKHINDGNCHLLEQDNYELVTEKHMIRPDSYYGVAKAYGEALGSYYNDYHGLSSIHIRIGFTISTDDWTWSGAAAALRLLSRLWGVAVPEGLALSLGADVPFFLFGGRALGIGRGEEVYPLREEPRRYCVLIYPGRSMDTAEAFRRLRLPLLTSPSTRHTIELFCGSVGKGICPRLGNDFEPVVFSAFRGLAAVKRSLLRSGAVMASLTGSGSVVFGVFEDYSQAQTAARRLRRPGADVFVARTVSRRELQDPLPGIVTAK